MPTTLGIHIGHDSSCALVHNGELIAAVQQERITRKKYDSEDWLSNSLPIQACLRAAGAEMGDINLIVSSFQAASPGGLGLGHPPVSPNFNLFDPSDSRHVTVSHHLAHAYSSFFLSGFANSAVLVIDQAGSSTIDGNDYSLPFTEWYQRYSTPQGRVAVTSECLSVYLASVNSIELLHREYGTAHNRNETYVGNAASLYDNLSRFVFRRENCYGQLMALAAYGNVSPVERSSLAVTDLVEIDSEGSVTFKNDWQHRVEVGLPTEEYAGLAATCQQAFELALLAYAKRAHALTHSRNLCVAGGAFLNIPANSRIALDNLFDNYFVPSAPHDAGISVGCAFFGDQRLRKASTNIARGTARASDRLGILYSRDEVNAAIADRAAYLTVSAIRSSCETIARMIENGAIVARCAGRAEFGPRALGGRSLFASPLRERNKERLNTIKGRQPWRPVAPVTIDRRVSDFFDGPLDSHYMSYAHTIRSEHRTKLSALWHPDNTTRCQSLAREADPWLYSLLEEMGDLNGYPILVNTSLNGRGEPIVETPADAVDLFLRLEDVDALALEGFLVTRKQDWEENSVPSVLRLAPGALISHLYLNSSGRTLITTGKQSHEISKELARLLQDSRDVDMRDLCNRFGMRSSIGKETFFLASRGILRSEHNGS